MVLQSRIEAVVMLSSPSPLTVPDSHTFIICRSRMYWSVYTSLVVGRQRVSRLLVNVTNNCSCCHLDLTATSGYSSPPPRLF